jgi:adenylate cyclase
VIEIVTGQDAEAAARKQATLPDFERGMAHYRAGEFAEAEARFTAVLAAHPDDGVASLYRERCRQWHAQGAPSDWHGVETLGSKFG